MWSCHFVEPWQWVFCLVASVCFHCREAYFACWLLAIACSNKEPLPEESWSGSDGNHSRGNWRTSTHSCRSEKLTQNEARSRRGWGEMDETNGLSFAFEWAAQRWSVNPATGSTSSRRQATPAIWSAVARAVSAIGGAAKKTHTPRELHRDGGIELCHQRLVIVLCQWFL